MAAYDAETDRPAVVLDEETILVEALEGEEALDDLGQTVEAIRPGGGIGSGAQPKAGVVGGQDVNRPASAGTRFRYW